MKFLQILLCLIVLSSLALEISAIQSNLIKKSKGKKAVQKWEWLFGKWNTMILEVTNAKNHWQKFEGENLFSFSDPAFKKPYGLQFSNLVEKKKSGNTGFISSVLSFETVNDKDQHPILDVRLVKDCSFSDNSKDWFGDWKIYFSVVGQDDYQSKTSQTFGNNWKVTLQLKNANKDLAKDTLKFITEACVSRSKEMNQFKKNAVNSGNSYYTLYDIQVKKQQTLEAKIKQGQSQANVLKSVQSEQSLKSAEVQKKIEANQQSLIKASENLKLTQAQSSGTQEEINQQNAQLEAVKLQLNQVEASQSLIKNEIVTTQAKLNEALNLQNKQQDDQAALDLQKEQLQKQAEAEKAEIARLLKAQEDRNAAFQAAQTQLNSQIATNDASISSLQATAAKQNEQAKKIDEQRKDTLDTVNDIQDLLEQKRDVAEQLKSKQSLQKAFQDQQKLNAANAKSAGDKLLVELAAQEKAQLDALDQTNKDVIAQQEDAANRKTQLAAAINKFDQDLVAIENSAHQAAGRTQAAFDKVNQNKHAGEINAIYSNSGSNIKRMRMRLAKQQKATARFAKLIKKQEKKIQKQRRQRRQRRHY